MKIEDVQERWDLGKVIVRLRCSHTAILDIDVQQRLGQPISEIREGGSLVCPMCSLPARHIRGEMGKLIQASGQKPLWVRPAEYLNWTRQEIWSCIGAPRADAPPPERIACISCGDGSGLVLLAQVQTAPGLPPNEAASRLAGQPVRGDVLLIGPQVNPWRE